MQKGNEAMDGGRGGSKCELFLLQILMLLPIRSRGAESPFDKRKRMSGLHLGRSTFLTPKCLLNLFPIRFLYCAVSTSMNTAQLSGDVPDTVKCI